MCETHSWDHIGKVGLKGSVVQKSWTRVVGIGKGGIRLKEC